jgi:hypothetical protein
MVQRRRPGADVDLVWALIFRMGPIGAKEYSALRERVRTHNESASKPASRFAVVVYGGQTVWSLDDGKESSDV